MAYTYLPTNNKNPRGNHKIERLTVHCVVGRASAEQIANLRKFHDGKSASVNYIVGKNGEVVMQVPEDYRAWTSGSRDNDYRAITIEVSSDNFHPYAFNDAEYKGLVELTVDIMKRNKKTKLVFIADKTTALNYQVKDNEMLITFHRWFQATACPGDWFISKCPEFVKTVNDRLGNEQSQPEPQPEPVNNTWYKVQVGAFRKKENAENLLKQLKDKGFTGFIVEYN